MIRFRSRYRRSPDSADRGAGLTDALDRPVRPFVVSVPVLVEGASADRANDGPEIRWSTPPKVRLNFQSTNRSAFTDFASEDSALNDAAFIDSDSGDSVASDRSMGNLTPGNLTAIDGVFGERDAEGRMRPDRLITLLSNRDRRDGDSEWLQQPIDDLVLTVRHRSIMTDDLELGSPVVQTLFGVGATCQRLYVLASGSGQFKLNITPEFAAVPLRASAQRDGAPLIVRRRNDYLMVAVPPAQTNDGDRSNSPASRIQVEVWADQSDQMINNLATESGVDAAGVDAAGIDTAGIGRRRRGQSWWSVRPNIFTPPPEAGRYTWHVSLPASEHLLWSSPGLGALFAWRVDSLRLRRKPVTPMSRYFGIHGRRPDDLPGGNTYAFVGIDPMSLQIRTISRVTIWLMVASSVLALAAIVRYSQVDIRLPLSLTAAAAIVGLIIVAPDAVVIVGQIAVAAMLLVVVLKAVTSFLTHGVVHPRDPDDTSVSLGSQEPTMAARDVDPSHPAAAHRPVASDKLVQPRLAGAVGASSVSNDRKFEDHGTEANSGASDSHRVQSDFDDHSPEIEVAATLDGSDEQRSSILKSFPDSVDADGSTHYVGPLTPPTLTSDSAVGSSTSDAAGE